MDAMMTFSHIRRVARALAGMRDPRDPASRRLARAARRMLAAGCAALAVLCALLGAGADARMRPVLVAQRAVARGEHVGADAVIVTDLHDHAALDGALRSTGELDGALAQVDIRAGDILMASMVGPAPTVPAGHTVVDLRLGERQEPFPVGTRIELASVVGCAQGADAICTISAQAVVMGPARDDDYGMRTTPVAMPAREAMRALAAQEEGAVIAIAAEEDAR